VHVSLPTCSYTVHHQLGHMQHQLVHIQFLRSCYVCGLVVSGIWLIYSSNLQFMLK
jgi:hypothetical protein